MGFICLHDKKEIERSLRKDTYLHIYSIGDLDSFFWPYTNWYGLKTHGNIGAVALLYVGQLLPTLLALSEERDVMQELLELPYHFLPHRFYAHLSPNLETVLSTTHDLMSYGEHYKMTLHNEAAILVSIAGIHVYSPQYKVAALGNIATLPLYIGFEIIASYGEFMVQRKL